MYSTDREGTEGGTEGGTEEGTVDALFNTEPTRAFAIPFPRPQENPLFTIEPIVGGEEAEAEAVG